MEGMLLSLAVIGLLGSTSGAQDGYRSKIAGPISYIPVRQQGRSLQSDSAQLSGSFTPGGGSLRVPGAGSGQQSEEVTALLTSVAKYQTQDAKRVHGWAVGGPAGEMGTSPKITPQLPPPAPPTDVPYISDCSGYITKEEIMAGLEYASGKAYMPFDECWDERLAALQRYYGSPGPVFPFHFLNPGAFVNNITFWLKALEDYQLGKAPFLVIHGAVLSNSTGQQGVGVPITPSGQSSVTPPESSTKKAPVITGYGINWYGGPVMSNGPVTYYLWYGNWGVLTNNGTAALPTTVKVLTDMAQSMGGQAWFNIATAYYSYGSIVPNRVSYGGRGISNAASACYQGASISDQQIFNAVNCAIQKGLVPYNLNGVYHVLGASNIKATSGMSTNYCGWHSYGFDSKNRQTIFGFIGSPLPCLNACAAQGASNVQASPNHNAEADAMASIISHETVEYTTTGYENADLCAWTFGTTFAYNGGLANLKWNCPAAATGCTSRYYLIQQNWVNLSPGYCSLTTSKPSG